MKKKLLFLTVIIFSVSSFAYDFEVDGIYYTITSSSMRTVGVTNAGAGNAPVYKGDIVIPETVKNGGKEYTVTSIESQAFYTWNETKSTGSNSEDKGPGYGVTSIVIPKTISIIKREAFGALTNSKYASDGRVNSTIQTVLIEGDGLKTIEQKAFYECGKLSSINLPNSVEAIGYYAFFECEKLTSIILPENLLKIENFAFHGTNITEVIIPSSCSVIGSCAFSSCLREAFYLCNKPEKAILDWIHQNPNSETYVVDNSIYSAYSTDRIKNFVNIDNNSFVYTGSNPKVTITNNLPFYNITTICTLEKDAGNYDTYVKVKYSGEKEFEVEIPYSYSINKAPAQLTVNNASKVYGEENPALSYELSGLIGNDELDNITISTTADLSSNAGSYPIKASVESKNYDVEITEGTLTIQKAPLVVQVNDAKKKYGDSNPEFTLSYTGLKCDDPYPKMTSNFTISTDATKASNSGKYDIEVSGGESNNYSFSQYKKGTLTIEPIPLTITPKAAIRLYGNKNPEFSFSYSGFVNGDDEGSLTVAPFATCQARPESEVGDYEITVDGAANQNYSISYGSAFLTVEKAPLLIQAEDVTREYGTANPEYTFKYSGFKNEEDESVLLKKPTAQSANIASAVGTYDIVSSGADAKNYKISYEAGKMTITQAPLSATAKDASKKYGDNNPKFNIRYTGFRLNDDETSVGTPPTARTDANASSAVGTYTIHLSGGASKNYYFDKYNDGTLTIEPVSLTITPNDTKRYYGDKNPEFTLTYSGFVNNDNANSLSVAPVAICPARRESPVGEYDITVDGAVSSNYNITYKTALLTVEKAPLVIQAENTTREYGTTNPEFTFKYTGFKNDEDELVLLKQPTAQSANIASEVGSYDIISSGAEAKNYKITYETGKMTITQAPLSATAKDTSREYGNDNPRFSIGYSGFRLNDDESCINKAPTARTDADVYSVVGTYSIRLSGGSSKNYYFEKYYDGTLTITKAYQNLVWNQNLDDVTILQEIELLAKADSKQEIEYSVSDDKIAVIEEVGSKAYLKCIGVGEVTVSAIQNGNDNYYQTNTITKAITVHNLPDNTATLEIKQAEQGSVSIMAEIGFSQTVLFKVTEGWHIHSVTFNGNDVTNEITDGTYTTPVITDASSLIVAYGEGSDAVDSPKASQIRVTGNNGVLYVTGTENGDIITIYDEKGGVVAKEVTTSSTTEFPLGENKLYVVTVKDFVAKILL